MWKRRSKRAEKSALALPCLTLALSSAACSWKGFLSSSDKLFHSTPVACATCAIFQSGFSSRSLLRRVSEKRKYADLGRLGALGSFLLQKQKMEKERKREERREGALVHASAQAAKHIHTTHFTAQDRKTET